MRSCVAFLAVVVTGVVFAEDPAQDAKSGKDDKDHD